MRSRKEKALWFLLALVAAAAAVLAWWTADQWRPQVSPWAEQALRRLTRPGREEGQELQGVRDMAGAQRFRVCRRLGGARRARIR